MTTVASIQRASDPAVQAAQRFRAVQEWADNLTFNQHLAVAFLVEALGSPMFDPIAQDMAKAARRAVQEAASANHVDDADRFVTGIVLGLMD